MSFLSVILSSAPVRILLTIGAGLAGLWVYGRGKRREGRDEAHRHQRDLATDAMKTRSDVEEVVRRSGDGTAADELKERWSRD